MHSPTTPQAAPDRRRFLSTTGAIGAGALFGGHAPAILAQSKAPLRIGLLNSFSKVFAALGQANQNGMQLYFDQIGNTIAGRKIEIVREDDEINPQVGLTKMKKLVEQWGNLPPRERAQALQEMTQGMSPRHREAIENYFRNLAVAQNRK